MFKKSSNRKLKLVLSSCVNAGHYIAFKHSISFATYLAANFGCDRFRITPDIISKLCAQPSEVAALFDWNLSSLRRPFLGQVVDSDLPLCTGFDLEHAVLFLCHIFTQRSMNDRKIERSDGRCLGWQQLLAYSIEISHDKNSDSSLPEIYKALKPCLELSQYSKSGSMFSSSEPVAARSDCSRLGNALSLCLCSPVRPVQAEQESS